MQWPTPKFNPEAVKSLVAHIIALMLVSGFLGLGTMALIGEVDLSDATTAAFAGTLLGYTIHRVEHAMQYYFGEYIHSKKEGKTDEPPK